MMMKMISRVAAKCGKRCYEKIQPILKVMKVSAIDGTFAFMDSGNFINKFYV